MKTNLNAHKNSRIINSIDLDKKYNKGKIKNYQPEEVVTGTANPFFRENQPETKISKTKCLKQHYVSHNTPIDYSKTPVTLGEESFNKSYIDQFKKYYKEEDYCTFAVEHPEIDARYASGQSSIERGLNSSSYQLGKDHSNAKLTNMSSLNYRQRNKMLLKSGKTKKNNLAKIPHFEKIKLTSAKKLSEEAKEIIKISIAKALVLSMALYLFLATSLDNAVFSIGELSKNHINIWHTFSSWFSNNLWFKQTAYWSDARVFSLIFYGLFFFICFLPVIFAKRALWKTIWTIGLILFCTGWFSYSIYGYVSVDDINLWFLFPLEIFANVVTIGSLIFITVKQWPQDGFNK